MTLVLAPGLLCRQQLWDGILAGAARRLRVRFVDHASAPTIAEVARRGLDSIPEERFALAGFSYGGYLALEMARQAPHRITHFALLSSQAKPDSPAHSARREAQIATATAEGGTVAVIKQQLPILLPFLAPDRVPPSTIDALVAAVRGGIPLVPGVVPGGFKSHQLHAAQTVIEMALQTSVQEFITQQRAIMSRGNREEALAELAARDVPILIAGGADDGLIPAKVQMDMHARCVAARAAAAAGAAAPGGAAASASGSAGPAAAARGAASASAPAPAGAPARDILRLVKGAGHMAILEQPGEVDSALADLLALPPAPPVENVAAGAAGAFRAPQQMR